MPHSVLVTWFGLVIAMLWIIVGVVWLPVLTSTSNVDNDSGRQTFVTPSLTLDTTQQVELPLIDDGNGGAQLPVSTPSTKTPRRIRSTTQPTIGSTSQSMTPTTSTPRPTPQPTQSPTSSPSTSLSSLPAPALTSEIPSITDVPSARLS